MGQQYVTWCVIHKGFSHVKTVQMMIGVNLNNQLLPKMVFRHFFTLTAHHWTLRGLWLSSAQEWCSPHWTEHSSCSLS